MENVSRKIKRSSEICDNCTASKEQLAWFSIVNNTNSLAISEMCAIDEIPHRSETSLKWCAVGAAYSTKNGSTTNTCYPLRHTHTAPKRNAYEANGTAVETTAATPRNSVASCTSTQLQANERESSHGQRIIWTGCLTFSMRWYCACFALTWARLSVFGSVLIWFRSSRHTQRSHSEFTRRKQAIEWRQPSRRRTQFN